MLHALKTYFITKAETVFDEQGVKQKNGPQVYFVSPHWQNKLRVTNVPEPELLKS